MRKEVKEKAKIHTEIREDKEVYFVKTEDNKELELQPLLDEKMYKGYSVDLKFEYISAVNKKQETTDGTIEVDPTIQAGSNLNGYLNCIKVIVDIYNGDKIIHSTSGTITFIQKLFKMDSVRGNFEGQKDVLLFRS